MRRLVITVCPREPGRVTLPVESGDRVLSMGAADVAGQLEGIDLPEADVERLKSELPKVEIQWTKPNETYMKRIQKLFGSP